MGLFHPDAQVKGLLGSSLTALASIKSKAICLAIVSS
jgi:hypothetical protein